MPLSLPTRSLLLGSLALLLVVPPGLAGAAHVPRAAVTFLKPADQPKQALKSLRALLEEQLEQHAIKVVRKPAPPLVSKSSRQIKPYARARRLDRVYEVRLRSRGKQVELVLTERKPPSMRSTFSVRLSAGSLDKVQKVIPKLVGALVARTTLTARAEPQPEQEETVAPDPQVEAKPSASAPATTAPPAAASADVKRGGEFLVGVSLDMGTFLHAAAGLYGGTAKLFYSWTSLRLGVELGGGGGGGTTFHLAARTDYVFNRSVVSPYLGAGLGYVMVKDAAKSEGGGGYFASTVGLEYTRLRKVRLLAEAEVLLPFFSAKREEVESRNGIVELVGVTAYSPAILFKLGCLY